MRRPGELSVTFWGVRGSIPTPDPEKMLYGGNTPCLEVRTPDGEIIIIDGGTGALPLGDMLMKETGREPLSLHFFLTHFHWDHIQGIPFFRPLYSEENHVKFYSMHPPLQAKELLEGQMSAPYFPVDFNFLSAKREFVEVPGKTIHLGGLLITSFPLNHPQGCVGYRFEYGCSRLVIATDTEHGNLQFDRFLIEAAHGADVLIIDAQFTPEEYKRRRGWGHGTWLEATRVAKLAGVKRLVLFHHDPSHDDHVLERIQQAARQEFAETAVAVEGQTISC